MATVDMVAMLIAGSWSLVGIPGEAGLKEIAGKEMGPRCDGVSQNEVVQTFE